MKTKDNVYCNNVGVYFNQLTKRKSYTIEEVNSENVRICNDESKLKWYSKFYFSLHNEPEIISIHIDDEINDSKCDAIEVTIEFSNSDKYWLTFVTPKYLEEILKLEPHFYSKNFVIVKNLNKDLIQSTIHQMDAQNELIENCHKY
ncbi:hypothetical protein [Chryseobacterium sp.]|uniref:hypothetical protein n=1 Tax=Chryseobacterium sp. TaxID=1871047 RepID=UPI002FC79E37